jgi:hypothetical protein
MKKTVYYFIVLLLLSGLSVKSQHSNAFKWLSGTWKISTAGGLIVEQWKIINDSTLRGKSVFVKNGRDTVPQETVELAYRNGDWYYTPTVQAQNNNEPVKFKVIFLRPSEFICENPAHDFPQRITYRRVKHQLFASIEGKKNGRYNKQNFDFSLE